MDIAGVIKEVTGKEPIWLEDYTDLWLEWYRGDVLKFHHYKVYNGNEYVKQTRRTLNMAKQICEDWANLLLNEKTEIAMGDEKNQENMDRLLADIKFWSKGNKGVEESFALGQGAFVCGVDSNKKPKIQFVNRTKIYPITVEDEMVTECAFVNINGRNVVFQFHTINPYTKNYEIRTIKGEKKNNDLNMYIGSVDTGDDVIFDTKSNIPWFIMMKPNISNNININSPMGISIYANSLDKLQGVDLAYDGFCNEMNIGKGRIFVDKNLTRIDKNGETRVFDNNDIAFYVYGDGTTENNKPLEFYNPTLRVNDFFTGVNRALSLLSSAVGFGENRYRFDGTGMTTATQVISENSEMFRTLKKHEIILTDTLIDIIKCLMYICNTFGDGTYKFIEGTNIEIKFDDSIIEDKESEKASDRTDVNMGIMSKSEYRAKWYNEDLETAKINIQDIENDNQSKMANIFSEE